jgi:hypothetical protein
MLSKKEKDVVLCIRMKIEDEEDWARFLSLAMKGCLQEAKRLVFNEDKLINGLTYDFMYVLYAYLGPVIFSEYVNEMAQWMLDTDGGKNAE